MFTIKSVVYPEKIKQRLAQPRHNGLNAAANATAATANFSCGSFVRFFLSINADGSVVTEASFSSNGCGFMVAVADRLADHIAGKDLTDLHGLAEAELKTQIQTAFGEFPLNRRDCVSACIEALRSAFADHRARQVEEFRGEKALICTCFGVSEETIETLIAKNSLTTVDEVTHLCKAGSGCGSCRMLIQEMLDGREFAEAG